MRARAEGAKWALVACLVLWGCGQEPSAEGTPDGGVALARAAAAAAGPAALVPLVGGVVRQVGEYVVELVSGPDGRIEAHVRDSEGQPVPSESVTVTAEVASPDGPVAVPLVRDEDRYVGTVVGAEGPSDVSVVVEPEAGTEVEVAFPSVEITAPTVVAEPLHSGQVTVVGDNRVEVATASDGQVYVSVTDMQGAPLPPDVVVLRHVTIVTPTGPRVVALRPQGAIFVGTLGVPPPPTFSVRFDLGVRGRWYRRVRMRRYRPLPPTAVVVVPPRFHHPGRGWAKGWGPRRVEGPRPHGKAWGHYRGKGPPGRGHAKGHYHGLRKGPPGHYRGRGKGGGPPGHYRGRGKGGGRGRGKSR